MQMRVISLVLALLCGVANHPVVARSIFPCQPPEVLDCRADNMIPLYPFAALLGATVQVKDKTIVVTLDGKSFTGHLYDLKAKANGTPITLAMAPFSVRGVIYVPVSSVVDALGGLFYVDEKLPLGRVIMRGPNRVQFEFAVTQSDKETLLRTQEIYRVNPDGTGLQQLTYTGSGSSEFPSFTSTGEAMVYRRGNSVYYQNAKESKERLLLTANEADSISGAPIIDPNGKRIAWPKRWRDVK